jgi:hypothetical protein
MSWRLRSDAPPRLLPRPGPGWPGRYWRATRLVSVHDADSRPIRKRRIDRPVEFGYKAQAVDNDDGIVVTIALGPTTLRMLPSLRQRSADRAARRTHAPFGHRRSWIR